MTPEELLTALDKALARREKWWRDTANDPDRLATAMIVALGEVRASIADVLKDKEVEL